MSWHLSKYNSQPGLPINGLILLMNSQGHVPNLDLESSFGIPRKFFSFLLNKPQNWCYKLNEVITKNIFSNHITNNITIANTSTVNRNNNKYSSQQAERLSLNG